MAIYEFQSDCIRPLEKTSFAESGIREREDLQRLLKSHIEIICPDILVISEGFREWEDSRREIDLLAIDNDANLVVIELKRTQDAGHAELQAIRYAAMVSAMTFDKAAEVYSDYMDENELPGDATDKMLEFLGWEAPSEDRFAQDVRIVLVSADFSKELTTSVLWLNQRALDIRCVRMRPYTDEGRTFVDVQQIIPLPEAAEYMVSLRAKAVQARKDRDELKEREVLRKEFWDDLLKRSSGRTKLFSNVSAQSYHSINTGSGVSGIGYGYIIRQHTSAVRLMLISNSASTNKARFDWLQQRQTEIEDACDAELDWRRCDEQRNSYIALEFKAGGYRDSRESWPEIQNRMIEAMILMEKAFSRYIPELRNITSGDANDGYGIQQG